MNNKEGFYMVESLNGLNTRIGLVWHNTKEVTGYNYNETVSKEVVDVIKLPAIIGKYLTRLDLENIAQRLKDDNNISDCFINFETV